MKKIMKLIVLSVLLLLVVMRTEAQCPGWTTPYTIIYITDNTPPTASFQWVPNNGHAPFTYSWVFDDGFTSNAASFSRIFPNANTRTVVATITDATGCSFTRTEIIDFGQPCLAAFSMSGTNNISFDGTLSQGYFGQATWDFGDGTTEVNTSMTPTHYYPNAGHYNVCLTISYAQNGCSSTVCRDLEITNNSCGLLQHNQIVVGQLIQSTLTANNTATFAISPNSIINTPLDSLKTTWDFGDGVVTTVNNTTTTHQFAQHGTYNICVTAQAKFVGSNTWCSDSYCQTVGINDCGMTPFEYNGVANNPTTVAFRPTSGGCWGNQRWDFGDGSPVLDTTLVGAALLHTFPSIGNYTVCFNPNPCGGSCLTLDCQTIYVGTPPNCNLSADSIYAEPQTSGYYTAYLPTIHHAIGDITYQWSNGETDIQAFNIIGGAYSVTITDGVTGCTAVLSDSLPPCHTLFEVQQLSSNVVSVVNKSSIFTDYNWFWGDGNHTTGRTPTPHTYSQSGTYTICLNTVNLPLYPCDPILNAPNPCPPQECQSGGYCVTVTIVADSSCVTNECVFPGDANYDGIANMYDLLPIGASYNAWGAARTNQDNIWYAHESMAWQQYFVNNNLNYKHSDCDGNAYINNFDIAAILSNYNRTHNYLMPTNRGTQLSAIPMYLSHTVDSIFTTPNGNNILYSDIMVGNANQTVGAGYGIAMRIMYPVGMIDPTQQIEVTWDANSWLARNTPTIDLVHDDRQNGILDIAISRTNTFNAPTGQGKIGRIKWVITDNINGRPTADQTLATMPFSTVVTEGSVVSKTLASKPVQGAGSTVIVVNSGVLNTDNSALKNQVRIFPNPVNNHRLTIQTDGADLESLQLHDILGKNVLNLQKIGASNYQIDTKSLPQGTYLLTVQTQNGTTTERVFIP